MTTVIGPQAFVTERVFIDPTCGCVSIPYGTDNELVVTITDGDGRAIPINNDTVTITVKDERGGNLIFEKTNGPGEHCEPSQGTTIFVLTPSDTEAADPYVRTVWLFEIRRVTGGGEIYAHIFGDFLVEPTI